MRRFTAAISAFIVLTGDGARYLFAYDSRAASARGPADLTVEAG